MASVGDVYTALEKFELDLIDKQWADDIWSSEFTSCPDDLPDEFSDKFSPLSYCDIVQVIDQADKVINIWLNDSTDASGQSDSESNTSVIGPSWTSLQDVDHKALLSVLYFYICKGQLNNQEVSAVHTCITATNFYYTLLMIPGSSIYKVFHLTLFEKCLETLSLHKYLEIATGRMIKKAKQKKNDDISSDDEYLEMDETMTLMQQQNVVKQLNRLLSTFQEVVKKFSFKKYPEALNLSLNTLAELTRIERNSSLQEFSSNNSSSSFCPFSRNAFLTMKSFCTALHGRVPEIVRLVLYYLMPNLTSVGGPSVPEMTKFNNKELTNIRNIAVSFVLDNIVTLGECSHHGMKILIQQICFNMIDRADYRSKACEMIVLMLCKLPMDLYYSLMKWVFSMSLMEGAHHRVIGLELLSRLVLMKPGTTEMSLMNETYYQHLDSHLSASQSAILQNRSEKNDTTTNLSQEPIMSFSQPINYIPLEYRRAMLAIIIDRIRDEAAIVRTRALSVLADLIGNKTSPSLQKLLREIFVRPYMEISSVNNEASKENEFLKWKSFVAALDKVRDVEVNRSMIPGGKALVSKVFEKCLDERVNVRKFALVVLSKIFKLSSKWMTDANLELFGRHCRDPALSIRKEMVGIVTELMLFFPDHEPLTKLWVEEVVPQITDREMRVQEQVLQVFTYTILNNLTAFDQMNSAKDELPWKLLDRIGEQKMRAFLVTACSLWKKTGDLSQHLIQKLKTHIGTVNDGPAWLFLSAISEYVDIDKPEVIMTHFLDVVYKEKGEQATSHLVLITLNNSWRKLKKQQQEILQTEIFAKLKSFTVHPTLVSMSVDIATGITVLSAENELAGKKEIAKWAMELIQDCETHLEDCLSPAPGKFPGCETCINILALLGVLAGICSQNIRQTTFVLLYEFLMKSKSGGNAFCNRMRAILVITLSKMALRCDFFARSLVVGLSQLLNTSNDPHLLNNVIVAIADIGERYANLIEPLISSICVCLKSQHKSLKEITLILLVELLQEDYLKARGALVFHLLSLVNDADPRAVNIVKYYFTNCLLARHPYKMYQLLLPGMFHYNNYRSHPDYPKLEMTDAECRAFDVSGLQNHQKRMVIYKFMLSNVPEMVRLKCIHFVCTVILNGVADNIISLKSKNGEQLLYDALCVLLTKEIKIEYNELVKKKNEDGEEEDDQKQNPVYKLGKQVFTAVQKKEIIETIVPICVKLKKKLLAEKKKLLPYLHKFLRELVKDYKDEINEIFKEDRQLGIEIRHEIENAEASDVEEEEDDEPLKESEELVTEQAEGNVEKNVDDDVGIAQNATAEATVMKIHIAAVIQERTSRKSLREKIKVIENQNRLGQLIEEDTVEEVVENTLEAVVEENRIERPPEEKRVDRSTEENRVALAAEENAVGQPVREQAPRAESKKSQRKEQIRPSDTSLIEEYDESKHVPAKRPNRFAQRQSSSDSFNSSSGSKQMEVRVQIERLNSTSSALGRESNMKSTKGAEKLTDEEVVKNTMEMVVEENRAKENKVDRTNEESRVERLPEQKEVDRPSEENRVGLSVEENAMEQPVKEKTARAESKKPQRKEQIRPEDTSLIEEYDEAKHAPAKRPNRFAQRQSSSDSCNSSSGPKQMEVRVQIERLNSTSFASGKKSDTESTKAAEKPADEEESPNKRRKSDALGTSCQKELSVSLTRIETKDKPKNDENESDVPEDKNKKLRLDNVSVTIERLPEAEKISSKRPSKDVQVSNENPEIEMVSAKKVTVSLERLPDKERIERRPSTEKITNDKTDRSLRKIAPQVSVVIEKLNDLPKEKPKGKKGGKTTRQEKTKEEPRKRSVEELSVSVERLSEKQLSKLPKVRKQTDEEAMDKAVGNIVMPPPVTADLKPRRRASVGTRCKLKMPNTPDGNRPTILTSTPMTATSSDFEPDFSPIVDDNV